MTLVNRKMPFISQVEALTMLALAIESWPWSVSVTLHQRGDGIHFAQIVPQPLPGAADPVHEIYVFTGLRQLGESDAERCFHALAVFADRPNALVESLGMRDALRTVRDLITGAPNDRIDSATRARLGLLGTAHSPDSQEFIEARRAASLAAGESVQHVTFLEPFGAAQDLALCVEQIGPLDEPTKLWRLSWLPTQSAKSAGLVSENDEYDVITCDSYENALGSIVQMICDVTATV